MTTKPMIWPARIRLWIAIAVMFLLGICGAIFSDVLPWQWTTRLAVALSDALLVAGFLALTVDTFLKTELLRDAFLAAFQYVLPPELKSEIYKLMKFEFIAERHTWTVAIKKCDEDTVLVETTVERQLKNVTSTNKNLLAFYQAFDFSFKQGKTEIVEYFARKEDGTIVKSGESQSHGAYSVERRIEEDIVVPPGACVTLYGKAIQYRRRTDIIFETFMAPSVNPEISVSVPDEFLYDVDFGTRGEGVEKNQYLPRHKLIGVYIPSQFMSVRWWGRTPT